MEEQGSFIKKNNQGIGFSYLKNYNLTTNPKTKRIVGQGKEEEKRERNSGAKTKHLKFNLFFQEFLL